MCPDVNEELKEEIRHREKVEEENRQLISDLNERISEMCCLSQINSLVQNLDQPLQELLKKIADIIPSGWLDSETIHCCIHYKDLEISSGHFENSVHLLAEPIHMDDKCVGEIVISLVQKSIQKEIANILKGKKQLLVNIADVTERAIARWKANKQLEESDRKFYSIIEYLPMPILLVDIEDNKMS